VVGGVSLGGAGGTPEAHTKSAGPASRVAVAPHVPLSTAGRPRARAGVHDARVVAAGAAFRVLGGDAQAHSVSATTVTAIAVPRRGIIRPHADPRSAYRPGTPGADSSTRGVRQGASDGACGTPAAT
jgi:hypothetical protein